MTQRRVTKGLNGPVESPTRWDRFKDRLSGTFSRNADTVVRKSMAGSNIGMALDFIGGASEETQKEALQWLRENGKYHNGMIKKMYNKALKEDGIWTELFVDAYQKSDEMEKTRLWSMMSEDLSTLFDRVEFCDIIDNELRNLSKLYVAVGQTDEKVDHTKCWESLKELFEGRGGNSVEIRKFALDILHASNYGLIEFWEGVLTYEENGDYNELKKHAIRLLLREENTGGEELLLENFDAVKENLTELMGEELNEHEAEGIMALMFRKMDSISQEEYNVIYMETILQMAVSDDEDVRRNMSTGLKRLNEKKDETAGRITHGLMINAKQMID